MDCVYECLCREMNGSSEKGLIAIEIDSKSDSREEKVDKVKVIFLIAIPTMAHAEHIHLVCQFVSICQSYFMHVYTLVCLSVCQSDHHLSMVCFFGWQICPIIAGRVPSYRHTIWNPFNQTQFHSQFTSHERAREAYRSRSLCLLFFILFFLCATHKRKHIHNILIIVHTMALMRIQFSV